MNKPPEECDFPGKDETETVQRVIYKHIFSVLPVLLVAAGLFVIGLILLYSGAAGHTFKIPIAMSPKSSGNLNFPLQTIGLIVIAVAILIGLAAVFIWRRNQMIVTNENVVDIDQTGLFRRTISTLRLSRVQDVTVDVKGPMQTLFHYGTITIQTAGEKDMFAFDYVPDPYGAKTFVQDMFEKFVANQPPGNDNVHSTDTATTDDDE